MNRVSFVFNYAFLGMLIKYMLRCFDKTPLMTELFPKMCVQKTVTQATLFFLRKALRNNSWLNINKLAKCPAAASFHRVDYLISAVLSFLYFFLTGHLKRFKMMRKSESSTLRFTSLGFSLCVWLFKQQTSLWFWHKTDSRIT